MRKVANIIHIAEPVSFGSGRLANGADCFSSFIIELHVDGIGILCAEGLFGGSEVQLQKRTPANKEESADHGSSRAGM